MDLFAYQFYQTKDSVPQGFTWTWKNKKDTRYVVMTNLAYTSSIHQNLTKYLLFWAYNMKELHLVLTYSYSGM